MTLIEPADEDDDKIDTDSIEDDHLHPTGDVEEDELTTTTTKSVDQPSQSDQVIDKIQINLVNKTIEHMLFIREQKLAKLSGDQRLQETTSKIHIPAIDLSLADSDDSKDNAATSRIKESKEIFKEPAMNVPFTREKLGKLCDTAIEQFYWPQLEQGAEMLSVDSSDLVLNESRLKKFFEPETDAEIGAETRYFIMNWLYKQFILKCVRPIDQKWSWH